MIQNAQNALSAGDSVAFGTAPTVDSGATQNPNLLMHHCYTVLSASNGQVFLDNPHMNSPASSAVAVSVSELETHGGNVYVLSN